MSYLYVKKQPNRNFVLWRLLRLIPALTFGIGFLALFYAGWPIFSYQVKSWRRFQTNNLVRPYSQLLTSESVLGESASSFFSVSGADEGLTQVKNWLPVGSDRGTGGRVDYYGLTISSLGIFNAVVRVGGEDLSRNLIQYGGTAYPGDFGNAVIFGHSVLPQFFNPKDYMTIFSLLPTMEYGDEILVDFDGARYRYQVEEMVEVKPDDLSILEQRFDDSYLSMVTCVPPGTYLRRLVVRARLIR
ncbi:MAG: sortase [Candidatus Shapirobacteria bacterium]|nr:sortase [Candidatus Shapirobacteria bacterium]MDD5073694.1 sortase [Candidatus Shapirobacteria bacterium]MDD5481785.1 sortase [Candidatus Shapirobacteria bacterium]